MRLFTLLAVLLPAAALAQLPGKIGYAGCVSDANGTPSPNGAHIMRFAIFDAPSAGAMLYQHVFGSSGDAVVTTGGCFSVEMDISALTFAQLKRSLYLEVQYETEAPMARVAINLVPYARVAGAVDWPDVQNVPQLSTTAASSGITITPGSQGAASFAADTTVLQRRLSQTCAGSNFVQTIDPATGTVTCAAPPAPTVNGVAARLLVGTSASPTGTTATGSNLFFALGAGVLSGPAAACSSGQFLTATAQGIAACQGTSVSVSSPMIGNGNPGTPVALSYDMSHFTLQAGTFSLNYPVGGQANPVSDPSSYRGLSGQPARSDHRHGETVYLPPSAMVGTAGSAALGTTTLGVPVPAMRITGTAGDVTMTFMVPQHVGATLSSGPGLTLSFSSTSTAQTFQIDSSGMKNGGVNPTMLSFSGSGFSAPVVNRPHIVGGAMNSMVQTSGVVVGAGDFIVVRVRTTGGSASDVLSILGAQIYF